MKLTNKTRLTKKVLAVLVDPINEDRAIFKHLDVYDKLRMAHSLIKDVLYSDYFLKLNGREQESLGLLSDTLYETEKLFANNKMAK